MEEEGGAARGLPFLLPSLCSISLNAWQGEDLHSVLAALPASTRGNLLLLLG